jgi:hypothetical protein
MNFSQTRRVIVAGMIGNVLEWYDFAVYGYVEGCCGICMTGRFGLTSEISCSRQQLCRFTLRHHETIMTVQFLRQTIAALSVSFATTGRASFADSFGPGSGQWRVLAWLM